MWLAGVDGHRRVIGAELEGHRLVVARQFEDRVDDTVGPGGRFDDGAVGDEAGREVVGDVGLPQVVVDDRVGWRHSGQRDVQLGRGEQLVGGADRRRQGGGQLFVPRTVIARGIQ